MNIILQLLLLTLGFVMLVKGSDWFVDGAAGIAAKFHIPQIIIGLTVVAMGTALPKLPFPSLPPWAAAPTSPWAISSVPIF